MNNARFKVFRLAFLQLPFKNFPHLAHVGKVIAGEFVGQIEAVPGVAFQDPAYDRLGVSAVVAPGGVVVVDAALHGPGDELGGLHLVDGGGIAWESAYTQSPGRTAAYPETACRS